MDQFTVAGAGHEDVVEVRDDLAREEVWLFGQRQRHRRLGLRQQRRQPLAVDVDAVADRVVLRQRQAQAVADRLLPTPNAITIVISLLDSFKKNMRKMYSEMDLPPCTS